MATTTTDSQPQVRMIALQQIRHDANIRELASEDIEALAGSIALLGQITPGRSIRPGPPEWSSSSSAGGR